MDEQKRLLVALVLIAVVVVIMTTFWPATQPQPPTVSTATEDVAAELESPAGEDAEPEASALVEAAPAPDRVREVRAEQRVRLKTSQIDVELTSHGGGLAEAILLDPQYREGAGRDAPQIDLVSVNLVERPELQPLAFGLARRRGAGPAATGSAEGQGLLRLLNHGSTTAEVLVSTASIGTGVASKLVGTRPFGSLADLEAALGGTAESRSLVLGKLLDAAWAAGFVRLDFEVSSHTDDRVVLRGWTDDDIEVTRTVLVASEWELRIEDRLRNRGSRRQDVRERLAATGLERRGGGGFLFGRPEGLLRGLCLHGDDMVRSDRGRLAGDSGGCSGFASCGGGPPGPASRTGAIRFVAVDRHFFMTAVTPSRSWSDTTCSLRADGAGHLVAEIEPAVFTELEPGAATTYAATVYLGPKQAGLLQDLGPGRRLWEAIDYGWFAFLSHWLLRGLRLFHGWFGNWGLAIIFLTFLIKLILLPVTHKTFKSMRQMQLDMAKLKPELDVINERYKDQPDVKQQKTLELYNTHGISPIKQLGGCLPMFLQMPIWIALYRMISESVELYRAPFVLWLQDLSAQDPYYILPGLLGVSMYLQQLITPQPGIDNAQAKMMRWMMPGMFLLIMLNMPAGLVLYIFVNTLLTIAQQQLINRQFPIPEALAKAKAGATPSEDLDGDGAGAGSSRRGSKSRRRKRK